MASERLLLIIEDDAAFARTLGRSFERRDYTVLAEAAEQVGTPQIRNAEVRTTWVDTRRPSKSGFPSGYSNDAADSVSTVPSLLSAEFS